jgi:hypothetical protein
MTSLPHGFHRIRLNLARSKDFPEGSSRLGYEFVAPLTAEGHIDLAAWKTHRSLCKVRHFRTGYGDEYGLLVHRPGGAEGATWIFDYDPSSEGDEESGYRFGEHAFRIGEYVSIKDDDGVLQTFMVTSTDAV